MQTVAPGAPASAHPEPPSLEAVLAAELRALERSGLRRRLARVEDRRGASVGVDGRAAADFSSNDYLGLAADPRVAQAAARALADAGTGAGAARLISGNHPLHQALEDGLARLKRTPAALLFPSGYAANTGAIPALVGRGDAVYSDELNHASLIDGCRLSRAEIRVFRHADVGALEAMLRADARRYRRRLIVVDAVFSMDGGLFPLDALVDVARRHGAWTYVDDAHGTGVLGATGRGSLERWGVEGRVDVVMGTLGKALGTAGAFVAGSAALCEWLMNRARPFVFTTAPPPALAAATLEALRIASAEPWRRERLRANARRLRDRLAALGRPARGEPDGHIVPVVIGGADETMRAGQLLRERGFLAGAVRPPTVPAGTSRLRLTLSAAHTEEQIDALLGALAEVLPPR
ncbi:MAG TPA: 8-amino-7-oxononanoate synthase [Longimicrobium sp.]|nr:8-amino-7-oxononanoate synthase [Longimicrobium sp.]